MPASPPQRAPCARSASSGDRTAIPLRRRATTYPRVMGVDAGQAYSRRAREYAELCGSMSAVHPCDRQLVDTWADGVTGRVIDAGCGPGHWTSYLAQRGVAASGVDLSEGLIAHASAAHPQVSFEVGDVDELSAETGSLGGLLSWYSLIHHEPSTIQVPLTEYARVLRPGGGLLVGFFESPTIEKFDHAVLDAYRWPVAELSRELRVAGFDVIEAHTRTSASGKPRPHGAIVAHRR
jgi:SAM-dependent methyltransferase